MWWDIRVCGDVVRHQSVWKCGETSECVEMWWDIRVCGDVVRHQRVCRRGETECVEMWWDIRECGDVVRHQSVCRCGETSESVEMWWDIRQLQFNELVSNSITYNWAIHSLYKHSLLALFGSDWFHLITCALLLLLWCFWTVWIVCTVLLYVQAV